MSNNKHGVSLIQLSNYVKPEIKEYPGRKWVLYGEQNWFFQYIIDRYNGSPTNEAIINTYCELIYGKGIAINGENFVYNGLNEIFNKREQKKCIADFKIFGQYSMQILRAKGGGVAKILHIPINKLGIERADENGDINNVYYCDDWTNPNKFKPEPYPIFKGDLTAPIMIKMVQPYRPGKVYWSDPNYLSGLQYAEMEEEISNYCINHIKSGLSFGYIINFNNGGALSSEQKDEIERMIREKLTGSSNAGKFILSFNDGKEAEVTVVPLEVNDAHNQWEFLTKESRQQLITAHGVFPNLFGINDGGGFANNADELNVQSKLLQDLQISPMQSMFIDELAGVIELAGLETDLQFIPLRETYSVDETVVQETVTDNTVDEEEVVEDNVELKLAETYNDYPKAAKNNAQRALDWAEKNGWGDCGTSVGKQRANQLAKGENISRDTISRMASFKRHQQHKDVPYSEGCGGLMWDAWGGSAGVNWAISKLEQIDAKLSDDVTYHIDKFLEQGEDIDLENWDIIDDRRCDEMTLNEKQLNTVFQFARVPRSDKNIDNSRSKQDTSLFKIRYQYAGNPKGERDFCNKVINSGKIFKAEVLNKEQYITKKMGAGGSNTYNPFLYKGGVNCKHWWQRVIFLKKNNEQISVNQAQKMILELEPGAERDAARYEQNDPKVAQSASASNNYWKYK